MEPKQTFKKTNDPKKIKGAKKAKPQESSEASGSVDMPQRKSFWKSLSDVFRPKKRAANADSDADAATDSGERVAALANETTGPSQDDISGIDSFDLTDQISDDFDRELENARNLLRMPEATGPPVTLTKVIDEDDDTDGMSEKASRQMSIIEEESETQLELERIAAENAELLPSAPGDIPELVIDDSMFPAVPTGPPAAEPELDARPSENYSYTYSESSGNDAEGADRTPAPDARSVIRENSSSIPLTTGRPLLFEAKEKHDGL